MRHLTFRVLVLAAGIVPLAACSDTWFGDAAKAPLPGERISVLSLERRREPDPAIAELAVRLPPPVVNPEWPEPGGYPNHAMQHLALGDGVKRAWRSSIGSGSSRAGQILASPVVFGNRVFTVDASERVRAFDTANGNRVWETDVKPEEARSRALPGGLAFGEDRVFVATGHGQVVALNAASGKEVWRQPVGAPIHGAPTVADGRVFVVTVENELNVLAADDGRKLWTHTGTAETAGLLGGSSPAVEGDVVIVPYSSGEIYALRVENGRPLWSDSLAATRRIDAMSTLADIRGLPVIDRGRVYAISHSGRLVSIDLRTGERAWEQEIGGTSTPWVAGDFVYVLSNEAELICLTRRDGRVKWVQGLPRYENPEKKRRPLQWTGPLLAGDRLVVLASNGEVLSLSPYTGEALGRVELPDGTYIPPVLANQTLYALTSDADLIAIR
jgi:outer membrane protein assembly factor BamB